MNTTPAYLIFFAALFTNNILLSNFLGMCHWLACTRSMLSATGLGLAMTIVTGLTTILNYLIYYHVLVPLGLEYLTFLMFIAVIAAFVQLTEMIVERFSPKLYYALGIFLPLMVVNCTIMGAALFMVVRHYAFMQTVGWGFGAGGGWMLSAVLMAALRKKAGYCNPPKAFAGAGLVMIIAGFMAMAFMGFAGMVAIE
ncbi:MAG: Rnf-Nqr domain containing protein [Chitinivibrionales bacterium]|nr:Rnf-Nqr domain containing protein [Chitinivibrionales bacterium]